MKLSSLFTTLLLFSILSSMAYGAIQVNTYTPSKDFSLTSAFDEVSICSCSTKYDSITVTNTGTWPAIFTISTNEISSKLTISQNSFELTPGQSQEVYLYITADCTRGNDDLKITVTSNLGPQKTIDKKIVRDRCQNIEMWVTNYTKDINPCDSKAFEINVHNIGPFADSYTVSSNYDDFITYDAKAVSLEPDQYAKFIATAKFGCDVYGLKDIIFTAHSTKNKLTATLDAQLNILKNYDYELKINGNTNKDIGMPICNRVYDTQIPVSITNEGSVANKYTLQFDGLSKSIKTDLVDNTIELNPGETKLFYINVDSSAYRLEQKSKDLNIKVVSELGDLVKESKVVLNFQSCYENQVIIYDNGHNNKKNALNVCAGYDYSYDVDIFNKGTFTETYTLSLEGVPSTIQLSKKYLVIDPGQKETVQLYITGPDYNTYYDVKVRATIQNGLSEVDDTWIKSYDTTSCHATSIGKSNFKINYQATEISIPIKNNGIVNNQYIISWEGSKIVNNKDIENTELDVNVSKTKNIILKINSDNRTEGVYTGKISVDEANGAIYSQDITIKLKDKGILQKTYEYLAFGNMCRQVSLYQIIAILLIIILAIVFLVRGPHYPYNFWNRVKSKGSVIVLLAVIFLVGVIVVITTVGFPQTHEQVYNLTQNDSSLTYEWLQDEKYTLDISKFFYDPDNSTLKYEITELKHIQVVGSSDSKKITFYPDKGWSGTEHVNILAYDSMGGKTTSPEFTLIVKDVPKKSVVELYSIYCWYVNLVIFAIVLLFVFVAVFVKQTKRTRKK